MDILKNIILITIKVNIRLVLLRVLQLYVGTYVIVRNDTILPPTYIQLLLFMIFRWSDRDSEYC